VEHPSLWEDYEEVVRHIRHEDDLVQAQTTTFATLLSILFGGTILLVSVSQQYTVGGSTPLVTIYLAITGLIFSVTWLLTINRTIDALRLWLSMAHDLENDLAQLSAAQKGGVEVRATVIRFRAIHKRAFTPGKSGRDSTGKFLTDAELAWLNGSRDGVPFWISKLSLLSPLVIWRSVPLIFCSTWVLLLLYLIQAGYHTPNLVYLAWVPAMLALTTLTFWKVHPNSQASDGPP
jgi:hypothetical protein